MATTTTVLPDPALADPFKLKLNPLPHTTTGTLAVWSGTKDGKEGYVDYKTKDTNIIPPQNVHITAEDIRFLDPKPTHTDNGYQLVAHPTSITTEQFYAADTTEGKVFLEEAYCREECLPHVENITGCDLVLYISFRIRRDKDGVTDPRQKALGCAGDSKEGGSHGPRPVAHLDRDPVTAIATLEQHFGEEETRRLLGAYKRSAQINVWRPIEDTVQKWPLVFMDHSRIPNWNYGDEFVGRMKPINDPRQAIRGDKAYDCVAKGNDRYLYRYASSMTPAETLVFSSYDSDLRFVQPHAAFWDDNTPEGAVPRNSIEVRTMAFWK